MPRKSGTKQPLRILSVEEDMFELLHRKIQSGETVYQTFRRIMLTYDGSEIEATQFMLKEQTEATKNWMSKAKELETERKISYRLDKFA